MTGGEQADSGPLTGLVPSRQQRTGWCPALPSQRLAGAPHAGRGPEMPTRPALMRMGTEERHPRLCTQQPVQLADTKAAGAAGADATS